MAVLLLVTRAYEEPIHFEDPALEHAIRVHTEIWRGPLSRSDVLKITHLDASSRGITSLEGIENLTRLTHLDLSNNRIATIAPLAGLPTLSELLLPYNRVVCLDAVRSLPTLTRLDMRGNRISDARPLASLEMLEFLNLRENEVACIKPLFALEELRYLNLHSNVRIQDLAPLAGLGNLEALILRNVPIRDQLGYIQSHTSLRRLNVRNCSIDDMRPLKALFQTGALQSKNRKRERVYVDLRDNMTPENILSYLPLVPYWKHVDDRFPYDLFSYPCNAIPLDSAPILPPPILSHESGFYDEPFKLTIHPPDPEVEILYTLDGSVPDRSNIGGQTFLYRSGHEHSNEPGLSYHVVRSHNYAAPIPIDPDASDQANLSSIPTSFIRQPQPSETGHQYAVIVRARVFKDGAPPSTVINRTFLRRDSFLDSADIPVISLIVDPSHLFDYHRGIYVPGAMYSRAKEREPSFRHSYTTPANYQMRGAKSDRPANVEFFFPLGETETPPHSYPVVIRAHGHGSRMAPLKSIRIYARTPLGAPCAFRPLFQAMEPDPPHQVLILRNAGNAHSTSFYHDAFMQRLVCHLPLATQDYKPAIHMINGEFWGVINIRDRMCADYIYRHYGLDDSHIAILDNGHVDIRIGSRKDRADFHALVDRVEQTLECHEEFKYHVEQAIDIVDFMTYFSIQIYINNRDWPGGNLRWWRSNNGSPRNLPHPYADGRWRWMLYDTDYGFGHSGSYLVDSLCRVLNVNKEGFLTAGLHLNPVNRLFVALLDKSPDFRHLFINTMADQMNTSFRPERVVKVLDQFEARIAPYREAHNRRWGVQTGPQPAMYEFARKRPHYQRKHIREAFSIPRDIDVNIDVSGTRPGTIRLNSIRIEPETPGVGDPPFPWNGIYFHGIPLEFEALPNEGGNFLGWVVTDASKQEGGTDKILLKSRESIIHFIPTTDILVRAVWK